MSNPNPTASPGPAPSETRTLFRVFLAHNDSRGVALPAERVAAWRDTLAKVFPGGGATTYAAVGRWGGADEPTTVVEALVCAEAEAEAEARLRRSLAGYRLACDQVVTLYTKQPGVVCVWG